MRSLLIAVSLVMGVVNTAFAQKPSDAQKTPETKNPIVLMETSMGKIKIELLPEKAPASVRNFLHYVGKKHYDGTIIHQTVPNYYIQGGELEPGLKIKKTDAPPVKSESDNGLSNVRGSVSLYLPLGSEGATASFFINVKNNYFLDRANAGNRIGYCVFGKVIEGMDVVDRISNVTTRSVGPRTSIPKDDIIIKSIRKIN